MEKVVCELCGAECKSNGIAAGYAITDEGMKICYDCCGKIDMEHLKNAKLGNKYYFYLCEEKEGECVKYFVSNWPGTFKLRVYPKEGRHNIAGKRMDFWFEYYGNNFHGVQYGNDSQIAHVRCVK